MYVHYDPLVCCWLNPGDWMNLDYYTVRLVAVGSWIPLALHCTTSGQWFYLRPLLISKFISFIVRKQHLASLQVSCRLVGTSIGHKQNTTLNPGLSNQDSFSTILLKLNTHCGISWCKTNTVVMILRRQSCSLILIYWTANWNRCYKVCVMTSYDVGHPIRWDQFRHRPQTVCREGASAIKSV